MIQTSIISKRYYHINNIDETEYSKIVWERKEKLEKYDLLKAESCLDETIFQVLSISRATLFRWKKQYKLYGLEGLENQSKRPHNVRKPTWSKELEQKIYDLRKKYPLWGKEKIATMYQRVYGAKIASSTVGRILKKLIVSGRIKSVNFLCNKKLSKTRVFNGHSQRWKAGMKANSPGELVQFDHMTIYVPGIGYLKQFNAICPTTKFAVEKLYKEATSRNGADFLEFAKKLFPFPIKSVQVDGGSEFMAEFELLCQKSAIPLWVLPPKSPECNGNVERGNGTFKYEFYSQYDGPPKLDVLQLKLQQFVVFYNNIRPHQGLGYLTPAEYIEKIKKMEIQSHMS